MRHSMHLCSCTAHRFQHAGCCLIIVVALLAGLLSSAPLTAAASNATGTDAKVQQTVSDVTSALGSIANLPFLNTAQISTGGLSIGGLGLSGNVSVSCWLVRLLR